MSRPHWRWIANAPHHSRRRTNGRLARAGIVLVAVAALVATTAGVASAGAPDFLRPRDLPRPDHWTASGIQQGVPEDPEFCLGHSIPAELTLYQRYSNGLEKTAIEYIHTAATDEDAIAFVKAETKRLRGCADRWLAQNPDGTARFASLGRQAVEDGVSSFGVFTSLPGSEPSANLFAIGRDGFTVTVVHLSENTGDVNVDEFNRAARRATARMLTD